LIPAHAGSTAATAASAARISAHPRSRGEHCDLDGDASACWGSSPLTRGALVEGLKAVADAGLIPAHAGSTACSSWQSVAFAAHPRSRGEHS
ncbi:hypothetical protein HMPREF3227_01731, partial [Corynebacterium sp. CMW7794]